MKPLSVSLPFVCCAVLLPSVMLFSACGGKDAQAPKNTAPESVASETTISPESSAPETSVPESSVPETAASAETETAADASYYLNDQDFLANVQAGLEQRWSQVSSQDGKTLNTEDFRAYASSAVQAELDAVGELYFYSFEDENLGGLASSYCSALQDQLAGIAESESQDTLQESELYMNGYCLRVVILHTLKEQYGLSVSEKYESNLESAVKRYDEARAYLGMTD
ncbi:MAG: hypothetical protein K6C06_07795 [Lachnospiraceae bacterium]|nr:hypothetical protein [Lachnospiraceae bacterium]